MSDTKEGVKIRALTNEDFFTVVDMLMKLGSDAGRDVTSLISSKKKADSGQERTPEEEERETIFLGLTVIQTCYKHVKDDLIKWFASLCGKSVKEYLALPPETSLQVMEYLAEAQEARSFFTRAWRLFKKIKPSAKPSIAKSKQ